MAELQQQFEAAAAAAKGLKSKPDNETLLQLYALYKQATTGNVTGKRPGFTDLVGRAKYDAWARLKDTPTEIAMQNYIVLVTKLQRT
jgi:acyl-CoA-binding protein